MATAQIPLEIKGAATDRLLTLSWQLTHKIHVVESAGGDSSDLRAERDIVRREILSRCGEA